MDSTKIDFIILAGLAFLVLAAALVAALGALVWLVVTIWGAVL